MDCRSMIPTGGIPIWLVIIFIFYASEVAAQESTNGIATDPFQSRSYDSSLLYGNKEMHTRELKHFALDTKNGVLTPGAIATLVLIVFVTSVLLVVLCAWGLHVLRRIQRLRDESKSCHTKWSGSSRDEIESYLQADFNDLARRHTNIDVHKCKSASCETCRPNIGMVYMLSVPRTTEVDCARQAGRIARTLSLDSNISSLCDRDDTKDETTASDKSRFAFSPGLGMTIDDDTYGYDKENVSPNMVHEEDLEEQGDENKDSVVSYVRRVLPKRVKPSSPKTMRTNCVSL